MPFSNDNIKNEDEALLIKARNLLQPKCTSPTPCALTTGRGSCPLLTGMLRSFNADAMPSNK